MKKITRCFKGNGLILLFLMASLVFGIALFNTAAFAAADLVLTTVSTTTTAIAPGGLLTVSHTIGNEGDTGAGSFIIAFHLSTNMTYGDGDDVVITAVRSVKSLKAGAIGKGKTKLTIPPSTPFGAYYLCASSDDAGAVPEDNEMNNILCTGGTFEVSGPDLHLTAVTPAAAAVPATGILSVVNTVHNQGVLDAGGSTVGFKLSPTEDYDDPDAVALVATRAIKKLKAGAVSTATTKLAVALNTPGGAYYLCAKTDAAGTQAELNETNNTLCSSGTITVPSVDLLFTELSAGTTTIEPGRAVTLSTTVLNQGGFPAGGFVVSFVLSPTADHANPDAVALMPMAAVKSLKAGAGSKGKTKLTIPPSTPSGAYYLCALIDNAGAVTESDKNNNNRCTGNAIQVGNSNPPPGPDENGTLLYSIPFDEGDYLLWHKIVVDTDGDAMALWDVANNIKNVSSVWARYYNHSTSAWTPAQKITNDDVVIYFRLPEAKFDQNGGFVVANTGINSGGYSTWWNRFDPATGWGTQRTLPDGRRAFGVNSLGEIFSQRPSNKEVARYNTNTGILTPDFPFPLEFGWWVEINANNSMAVANSNGELLEARAHTVTGAEHQIVVSLFSYSPVGGWDDQFDTPVLTYPNAEETVPLRTAVARNDSGNIAVVVAGSYCDPCTFEDRSFIAAIYFDEGQWGNWTVLDSSTQVSGVTAPSVKIDTEGRAVAIWSNMSVIPQPTLKLRASRYTPGSGWGTATDLNTAGTLITSGPNTGNYTPEDEFTMSDGGDAIVSWMDLNLGSGDRIRENRFHPATGWAGEAQVFQFPTATTAGNRIPKAQVNSAGKGFRIWVWVTFDSANPLDIIEQLRAAPVTTP
jgi:hypothetical protein